jgi:pyruvate formate lyase activating enzyme
MTPPRLLDETLRLARGPPATAVDTCGAVPWRSFERVLPYADLFLYDVKIVDGARHKAYTGADNREILENLKGLCRAGKDVIVRVPLIPGHTDAPEDIGALGDFIVNELQNQIRRVELLPYNKLAESKYGNQSVYTDGGVGREYPLPGLKTRRRQRIHRRAENPA